MRFDTASDAAPVADTITGAERIARALSAAGATHAFGIPGGEVLALVDALERAGIRFLLAKHENAAGFMAEGLWHVTGALPVLVTTLGPGVTNAVTVIAHALQDRVPLVVLTGCVDQALAESYTHQIFDHQAMLRPLVKASFRAAPGRRSSSSPRRSPWRGGGGRGRSISTCRSRWPRRVAPRGPSFLRPAPRRRCRQISTRPAPCSGRRAGRSCSRAST